MHSTGIGDGIALPHARNALPGLLDRPIIVFGDTRRELISAPWMENRPACFC